MAVGDNLTVAWSTAVVIIDAFEKNDDFALEKGIRELIKDLETAKAA